MSALFSEYKEFSLSDEQLSIIKAYRDHSEMRINAYAGTGKTTTLLHIARAYPSDRFIILCFNKSVADELNAKIKNMKLKNAKASTIHALAYSHYARKNAGRIKIINERELTDILLEYTNNYVEALFYSKIYEAYCKSEYVDLDETNVKKLVFREQELRNMYFFVRRMYLKEHNNSSDNSVISNMIFRKAIETINYVREYMHANLIATHSHYLKEYQRYVLKSGGNLAYDTILLDEGQDVNGLMLSIITGAMVRKRVVVGDVHQSIYGWNGSVNALSRLYKWPQFYLTRSYRFKNSNISDIANLYLEHIKKESQFIVPAGYREVDGIAYISNTNAELVNHIMEHKNKFKTTRKLEALFSDIFIADKIIDYYRYGEIRTIGDLPKYIQAVIETSNTLDDFKENIKEYDYNIFQAVRICEKIRKNYNSVYELYYEAENLVDHNATLTLTTAHTAKGLEWNTVIIAPDFPEINFLISNYMLEQYMDYVKINIENETDQNQVIAQMILDLVHSYNHNTTKKVLQDEYMIRLIKHLIDTALNNRGILLDTIASASVDRSELIKTLLVLMVITNNDAMSAFLDSINLQYVAITRASQHVHGTGLETITKNFSSPIEQAIKAAMK